MVVLPTSPTLAAVRRALGLSQTIAAMNAGTSLDAVARAEEGSGLPASTVDTVAKLVRSYERQGVEFLENGFVLRFQPTM